MRVDLIASTQFYFVRAEQSVGGAWAVEPKNFYHDESPRDCQDLIEFAGRACYQSWNRPNPKTAANADYIKHIIDVGHDSVLEHAVATFYVQGVSRALSHELVRHRHLSFSQMSQRYVDESEAEFIVPPALRDVDYVTADDAKYLYTYLVSYLVENAKTRKQAREAARSVLPNGIETRFVVTGNFRAWRDVIKKRNRPEADAEIQLLAREILRQLKDLAPDVFGDL